MAFHQHYSFERIRIEAILFYPCGRDSYLTISMARCFTTYLARLFYHDGFHIVILPSPMSWNFALSASARLSPVDARDLYEVMQKTLSILRSRYNGRLTGINFVGLSLGALEGACSAVWLSRPVRIYLHFRINRISDAAPTPQIPQALWL